MTNCQESDKGEKISLINIDKRSEPEVKRGISHTEIIFSRALQNIKVEVLKAVIFLVLYVKRT